MTKVTIPRHTSALLFHTRQIQALLGVHTMFHDRVGSELLSALCERFGLTTADDDEGQSDNVEVDLRILVDIVHRILNKDNFKYCSKTAIRWTWNVALGLHSVVIMLAGTSGVGKSTLASVISSKFLITNLLSTDSIRHAMRARDTTKNPILYASTYECGRYVAGNETMTEQEKTLAGFYAQCGLLEEPIKRFLLNSAAQRRSVILEGVHLVPGMLEKIMEELPPTVTALCFVVRSSKVNHLEHMKWRGVQTDDGQANKYVDAFDSILTIQHALIDEASRVRIPVLDSYSVDKCVSLIQATLRFAMSSKDERTTRVQLLDGAFANAKKCVLKSKTSLFAVGGRERVSSLIPDSSAILGML